MHANLRSANREMRGKCDDLFEGREKGLHANTWTL